RHVGVVLLAGGIQRAQVGGQHHVIGVHKGVIAAARGVDAGVARGGKALVLLVEHAHPRVFGGIFVADLAAAVGGTVVHQQDFIRYLDVLCQNAVQTLG